MPIREATQHQWLGFVRGPRGGLGGNGGGAAAPAGVRLQKISALNSAEYTVSTVIPIDDSTPLISEGTEIFSEAFTATAADSIIVVKVKLAIATSSGLPSGVIWSDSTLVGSAYKKWKINASGELVVSARFAAGDTAEKTISVRYGASTGNAYLNRATFASRYNGSMGCTLEIEEWQAP